MLELEEWPAADRNKQPILEVLSRVLPKAGLVLEIASGTGQHIAHFAAALPGLTWQPSDCSDAHLATLHARRELMKLPNLLAAVHLDVSTQPWPTTRAEAVYNANMIHISDWAVTLALFAGASQVLLPGSPLVTYGPYALNGQHTSESNAAFDASLRGRNPAWGVRDLNEVSRVASAAGFELTERISMPANNFSLVWTRR
jgi:SAM-dependent methyltransferase